MAIAAELRHIPITPGSHLVQAILASKALTRAEAQPLVSEADPPEGKL